MVEDITGEPTVLIVEDDAELADMYFNWLKDDYHVEAYLSGEDALERLRPDIDVVLLDRRLPDVSGEDILREIRGMQLPTYVVMVTGIRPDAAILELEFDDYLVKPVTQDDLRDAVERMLDRQRHDERLRELFQIISKLATIEAKMETDRLRENETYLELESRLESLWEEISSEPIKDELYQEGTIDRLETAISKLDTRS